MKDIFEVVIEDKLIKIPVVEVNDIKQELNFKSFISYPDESLKKSLNNWKMEIDDSPIFRYIYKEFQPKRHLEFGTWRGTGALYCLEETSATVWTINLPFGEKNDKNENSYGNYAYERESLQNWAKKLGMSVIDNYVTDSIGFIGKDYLEKELGNRVCQIYCDSMKWDNSSYPPQFFDTVLIDGAHKREIVINDTMKGLEVLKDGGIIMWHDFCPPIWQEFEVTRGVMSGISEIWNYLQKNLSTLFWIKPSWILVGIKNDTER